MKSTTLKMNKRKWFFRSVELHAKGLYGFLKCVWVLKEGGTSRCSRNNM